MKTYEQFRDDILRSERFKEMTYAELETSAAKEYAKQWVEEAAMLASSTASMGGDVVNTTLELLKEIDAQ